jgi:hypothetical protein
MAEGDEHRNNMDKADFNYLNNTSIKGPTVIAGVCSLIESHHYNFVFFFSFFLFWVLLFFAPPYISFYFQPEIWHLRTKFLEAGDGD